MSLSFPLAVFSLTPAGWVLSEDCPSLHEMTAVTQGTNRFVWLSAKDSVVDTPSCWGYFSQIIDAAGFRGRRVVFSADILYTNSFGGVMLMLKTDGTGADRFITVKPGHGWRRVQVERVISDDVRSIGLVLAFNCTRVGFDNAAFEVQAQLSCAVFSNIDDPRNTSEDKRRSIIDSARDMRNPVDLKNFVGLLSDQDPWVRLEAGNALAALTGVRKYPAFDEAIAKQVEFWTETVSNPGLKNLNAYDGGGGIGAYINVFSNYFTIASFLPDSGAEKAGLRLGDRVTRINAWEMRGQDVYEVVEKGTSGPVGTVCVLRVVRSNQNVDIPVIRTSRLVSSDSPVFSRDSNRDRNLEGPWKLEGYEAGNFIAGTNDLSESRVRFIMTRPDFYQQSVLYVSYLSAKPWIGKRVVFSGEVKANWLIGQAVIFDTVYSVGGVSSIGDNRQYSFQNPFDWTPFRCVMDIPGGGTWLKLGIRFNGAGWVELRKMSVKSATLPCTPQYKAESVVRPEPVNLDLERWE